MMSHVVQMKFWQHNTVALQLHAQKWCSGEHQGYAIEILSRPRVTSEIARFDGHSEAIKKWDNSEPTWLISIVHVTHVGLKRVMHKLHNSKCVCNT
jgi:hypothetical protein